MIKLYRLRVKYHHLKSLIYGALFKSFYWGLGSSHWLTEFFLGRYRNTRRKIPGGHDFKTGYSTRYGASEAHQTTQE